LPGGVWRAAEKAFCGLFQAVFPDDCRVCGEPLREVSRIPVCSRCLHEPEPLNAEFFCIACRAPFLNRYPLDESGRCMACRMGLTGFDAVYTYGIYDGTLRKLIHVLKYRGVRPLARHLGSYLARALPGGAEFDVIVPMPMHWRRRWTRGFNHADALARELSKRSQVRLQRAVRRVRATRPQVGLTSAKRRVNVRGAFRAARGVRLDGLRVLLVDDVLTTGATAAACARALKAAGAAQVALAAVARPDRRSVLNLAAGKS
jgi:ComF family protein